MTPRERVVKALEFDNPDRAPRDLWLLPAVKMFQKQELEHVLRRFPMDIGFPKFKPGLSNVQKRSRYPAYTIYGLENPIKGYYIDEWGSIWYVAEDGVLGEVKKPALENLAALKDFSPPWEFLESLDLSQVNESCERSDKFMLSGVCARPFERMQFIRGTANFFKDLLRQREQVLKLRDMVHEYTLEHIKKWLGTKVDGIFMMDDWGAQNRLLISPELWRELLKPLYKEYCDIVHAHGKYVFFHSDGFIEEIFDDLIEIGIDAINCQLFCMDIEKLAGKYKGKITFWGEIDRQKILPFGTPEEVKQAVYRVRRALDDGRGGVIAQCEWGKNNPVENIMAVFEAWDEPLEAIRAKS